MTTTDRELLERAAKAAGMRAGNGPGEYAWHPGLDCLATLDERNREVPWNPLHDDGDALRLAVKLSMSVEIEEHEASTYAYAGPVPRVYAMELWRDDKDAATRRAIVRAAAAMAGEGE